ncbi:hypothetical protein L9F63_012755, partial [Diploptera punctata]
KWLALCISALVAVLYFEILVCMGHRVCSQKMTTIMMMTISSDLQLFRGNH